MFDEILDQVEQCIDGESFEVLEELTREVDLPLSGDELEFEKWKTRLFIECFSPYMLVDGSIVEIKYDSISDEVIRMEFSYGGEIESVERESLEDFIQDGRHYMSARIPTIEVYEWWLESISNE